jgi:hypothetical protein
MVKYWPQMVKYWTSDGVLLAPGWYLASGWVNSGPEMLPEKLGAVLEKNIKQTTGCVDLTEAC